MGKQRIAGAIANAAAGAVVNSASQLHSNAAGASEPSHAEVGD